MQRQEWGGDKPDSDDDKNADEHAPLDLPVEIESLRRLKVGFT